MMRRLILALVLIAGFGAAFAQSPPPVPALPDTERRTTYNISATTCACSIGFQLYGDSTDYQNWIEVWINGTRVNYSDPAFGWAITSPTGSIATIPRPITDAVLTFTTAQTGVVLIVGARRPRRTSQFNESQPVPTRNFNQVFSDIIATIRELWDKTNDVTGRSVQAPPGETMTVLPPLANRAGMNVCFDAGGNLVPCATPGSTSFSAGNGVTFTGTNPTTIATNLQAGPNITLTGTNPITISGAYSLSQRGYISGLTLANDVITPNTIIDIAAGVATSDDQTTLMSVPAAITKNMNAVWTVGSGNGCADGANSYTTLQASTTYHLFEIERLDTQVVDVLCSKSATAPTFPGSYTVKRRIGSIFTDGSANIIGFSQVGFEFLLKHQGNDVANLAPGVAATLYTLSVPNGIVVNAILFLTTQQVTSGNYIYISSPDQADDVPSVTNWTLYVTSTASVRSFSSGTFRTNSSGQVRARADGAFQTLGVQTRGWIDNL